MKEGDDVGREKASWVEDRAWSLLGNWFVSEAKSEENQPMSCRYNFELSLELNLKCTVQCHQQHSTSTVT